MEKLYSILKSIRPDVSFEEETALIDDGILDSFDVVSIVNEVSDVFNVEISLAEIEPEDFNSAESIYALVESLK